MIKVCFCRCFCCEIVLYALFGKNLMILNVIQKVINKLVNPVRCHLPTSLRGWSWAYSDIYLQLCVRTSTFVAHKNSSIRWLILVWNVSSPNTRCHEKQIMKLLFFPYFMFYILKEMENFVFVRILKSKMNFSIEFVRRFILLSFICLSVCLFKFLSRF